ncbi:MAG: hypothetical protein IEMM0008_0249 [bacterium]|nr:MAG: hypothetical protein IEMM0008_0249 [bacterium]
MATVVVDTNVLVVANEKSDHVDLSCIMSCIKILKQVINEKIVAIDSIGLIFEEYHKHASLSGEPGLGDQFYKWLHENQGYSKHCELFNITRINDDLTRFKEFPDDPDLAQFDPSDKKFVAVVLASKNNPSILNATDSGWRKFKDPLEKHGIRIEFVCNNSD